MKTKAVAGAAIIAVLAASFATLAFVEPAFASSPNPERAFPAGSVSIWRHDHEGHHPARVNLTVGQTITLSGLVGRYVNTANRSIRGNASGSFTLTVTGAFRAGFTLSLTAGTVKVGDTTYTVSGGSVTLGPHGRVMVGSGTAGQGVAFLIRASAYPSAAGATRSVVLLDLQNGSAEYLVGLRTPKA